MTSSLDIGKIASAGLAGAGTGVGGAVGTGIAEAAPESLPVAAVGGAITGVIGETARELFESDPSQPDPRSVSEFDNPSSALSFRPWPSGGEAMTQTATNQTASMPFAGSLPSSDEFQTPVGQRTMPMPSDTLNPPTADSQPDQQRAMNVTELQTDTPSGFERVRNARISGLRVLRELNQLHTPSPAVPTVPTVPSASDDVSQRQQQRILRLKGYKNRLYDYKTRLRNEQDSDAVLPPRRVVAPQELQQISQASDKDTQTDADISMPVSTQSDSDVRSHHVFSHVLAQAHREARHRPDRIDSIHRSPISNTDLAVYVTPPGMPQEIFFGYRTPPASVFANINASNYNSMLARANQAIERLKETGVYQKAVRIHHIAQKTPMAKRVIRQVIKKHPLKGKVYRTDLEALKHDTTRIHEHAKHHSKEHMMFMRKRLRQGDSFTVAHKKAMMSVGK